MDKKQSRTTAIVAGLAAAAALMWIVLSNWAPDPAVVEVEVPRASTDATGTTVADDTAADVPKADQTTEPVEETAAQSLETGSDTADAEAPTEAAAPVAPKFDVVRIDVDGSTVVAGQAAPGATVEIVLDGEVIATETADGAGQFVSLFTLDVSGEARRLVLRTQEAEVETELAASAVPPDTAADQEPASREAAPGTGDDTASTTVLAEERVPSDTVDAQRELAGNLETDASGESAPVLILPGASQGSAPAIVQPERDELALLQPAAREDRAAVRLDRISYTDGGAVDLLGRATPGNRVRVYANAVFVTEAAVVPAGQWRAEIEAGTGKSARLLRFDEVDAQGQVVSRIETPFSYEIDEGPKELRQRTVEIARGDYLWRIAEQYYGEGIRYSLIFSANSELIKDPDLIYPGQVFTVPELVDSE
ncbi:MAG: LysM peptidoglycan-binding domain-containing protein [Pseudomonadota bacterium]